MTQIHLKSNSRFEPCTKSSRLCVVCIGKIHIVVLGGKGKIQQRRWQQKKSMGIMNRRQTEKMWESFKLGSSSTVFLILFPNIFIAELDSLLVGPDCDIGFPPNNDFHWDFFELWKFFQASMIFSWMRLKLRLRERCLYSKKPHVYTLYR